MFFLPWGRCVTSTHTTHPSSRQVPQKRRAPRNKFPTLTTSADLRHSFPTLHARGSSHTVWCAQARLWRAPQREHSDPDERRVAPMGRPDEGSDRRRSRHAAPRPATATERTHRSAHDETQARDSDAHRAFRCPTRPTIGQRTAGRQHHRCQRTQAPRLHWSADRMRAMDLPMSPMPRSLLAGLVHVQPVRSGEASAPMRTAPLLRESVSKSSIKSPIGDGSPLSNGLEVWSRSRGLLPCGWNMQSQLSCDTHKTGGPEHIDTSLSLLVSA